MNQEIAISVKNKIAETDFSEVVSFNSVYRLKFAFDEEWNEYPFRVAVVMWANGAAEKLFSGTECEMPQIVSPDADNVLIGVYSRFGDKRIASSFVRLRCEAGAGGFPQPRPSLSLHEQILSFVNQKDWDIFEDKLAEGVYSAVRVNKKGFVTQGMNIIEVGKMSSDMPSHNLAPGGIFFRQKDGVYTPCYYDGDSLQELTMTAKNLGHTLKIGDQTFDGTEDITVKLGKLASKDTVGASELSDGCVGTSQLAADSITDTHIKEGTIGGNRLQDLAVTATKLADGAVTGVKIAEDAVKPGDHIKITRDETNGLVVDVKDSVFSVNGQTGDVTIDQDTLGLANVAFSGNYRDLVGAPAEGVHSVNGQTGSVVINRETLGLADIAVTGSFHDLVDAPEYGVLSVNGQTGNVQLTGQMLDLADVALSGDYDDLLNKPAFVKSVNGLSGEVTLDATKLGLGKLASMDKVTSEELSTGCIGTSELSANAIMNVHIKQGTISGDRLQNLAVKTAQLGDNAVTGRKIAANTIQAGANIAISRNEENNLVISTALETGVTSVNGKTGDVTLDKESLGLGDVFSIKKDGENGADFNDLTCGIYNVIGTSQKPCSHMPASLDNVNGNDCYWVLFAVPTQDGSRCVQIAFSGREDGSTRIRFKSEGVWSAWKSIYA